MLIVELLETKPATRMAEYHRSNPLLSPVSRAIEGLLRSRTSDPNGNTLTKVQLVFLCS